MSRAPAVALLIALSASFVAAQTTPTTRLIPYSGTATDDAGSPLRGSVRVVLELYEDQEGGAPLWRETQRVQTDDRGRYLLYLGAVTPIPQIALSEERARWLGLTVEGRALARVMLVSVPYALRAADADTLGGQPASSFVRSRADGRLETSAGVVAEAAVDGTGVPGQLAKWSSSTFLSSSVISESATNRVGVGLPDPTGGGVVDSVFTIRNFDNNTGLAVLNQAQQRRFALNTLATGGWMLFDGGTSIWNAGLAQINGRVAVGTAGPETDINLVGRVTVRATSAAENGLFARKTATDSTHAAIYARSGTGVGGAAIKALAGVADFQETFYGSTIGVGGFAAGSGSIGVHGWSTDATGIGVFGAGGQYAGRFGGDVSVVGTLTKGGGAFEIDHPLDPANKYLRHSFVESPDMLNVYNGNIVLDASGAAWVTLPEWFEALNRDFRYQLTPIGAPGPNLYVAAKVAGNRFRIAGGTPGGEVSWQVTGIRHDAWANANRIVVEENKPTGDQGFYLHPAAIALLPDMTVPSLRARLPVVIQKER